jgi:hypothetical protein
MAIPPIEALSTERLRTLIADIRRGHAVFLLGLNLNGDVCSVLLRTGETTMTPWYEITGTADEVSAAVARQLTSWSDYTDYRLQISRCLARHGHATLVVTGYLRRVLCCDVEELRRHG